MIHKHKKELVCVLHFEFCGLDCLEISSSYIMTVVLCVLYGEDLTAEPRRDGLQSEPHLSCEITGGWAKLGEAGQP